MSLKHVENKKDYPPVLSLSLSVRSWYAMYPTLNAENKNNTIFTIWASIILPLFFVPLQAFI
jgi:hypothetical protein